MSSKTAEAKVFTKTIGSNQSSSQKTKKQSAKSSSLKIKKFPKKKQAHLFRGLASMLKAQINTADSLKYYAHGLNDKIMSEVLLKVREDIGNGLPVYEAFRKTDRFDDMTIGLIHAGTDSGRLDKAFAALAHRITRELYFKKAIQKALIVPSIVISVLVGAFIVSQVKLVPQVKQMMSGVSLPPDLITKISFRVSELTATFWPYFVLSVLALVLAILFITPFRNIVSTFLMSKWRLLRLLIMSYQQMTFISVMHLLNSNGINLGKSIRVSADSVKKTPFYDELREVADKYQNTGVPVAIAFDKYSSVDPQVVHMMSIGEKSASMDSQLKLLSDMYEEDSEAYMEQFAALLNFVVLIIAVLLIAMVYTGTFLPIFLMGPRMMSQA